MTPDHDTKQLMDDALREAIDRAFAMWEGDPRFHAPPEADEEATPLSLRDRKRTRLLTTRDVADLLSVTPGWVAREARAGRLPFVRVGRYRRFRPAEIEQWLDDQAAIAPSDTDVDDG